jgi:hypothetical protein
LAKGIENPSPTSVSSQGYLDDPPPPADILIPSKSLIVNFFTIIKIPLHGYIQETPCLLIMFISLQEKVNNVNTKIKKMRPIVGG